MADSGTLKCDSVLSEIANSGLLDHGADQPRGSSIHETALAQAGALGFKYLPDIGTMCQAHSEFDHCDIREARIASPRTHVPVAADSLL